jgi:hypothetical protein
MKNRLITKEEKRTFKEPEPDTILEQTRLALECLKLGDGDVLLKAEIAGHRKFSV